MARAKKSPRVVQDIAEVVDGRSTTFRWEMRRVPVPPEANRRSAPNGRSIYRLSPRERRKPLHITVTWRGGTEAWFEIHARGCVIRRPGSIALLDLMRQLYGD